MEETNNQNFEEVWQTAKEKALKIIKKDRPYKISKKMIRQEIDNNKKYFVDSKHPLSFFTGRVNSDELAEIISRIVVTDFSSTDREYMSNLRKNIIDMNLEPFHTILGNSITNNDKEIEDIVKVRKILDYISSDGVEDIRDKWPETQKILQGMKWEEWTYILSFDNSWILMNSHIQKNIAKFYGVQSVYYKEVEKYIEWSAIIIAEYMIQPIKPGVSINRISNFYHLIEQAIDSINSYIMLYEKEGRKLVYSNKKEVAPIIQKGVLRAYFSSIFYEEKIIEDALVLDVKSNQKDFFCPEDVINLFSEPKINPDVIIRAFTGKQKKRANQHDRKKIENVKKFITKWNATPGFEYLGREDDYFLMFVVYKELLSNAAKPDNYRQSKTIVGDFIDDYCKYEMKNSEEIFIILNYK